MRSTIRAAVIMARQLRTALVGLPLLAGTLTAAAVPSYRSTYPTAADLDRAVLAARGNPAMTVVYGVLPSHATSVQLAVWEFGALSCLVLAVLAAASAVALSRGGEDAGRAELLRSVALGPSELVAACAMVVTAQCALLGLACGLGLLSLPGTTGADSLAYGGAVGGTCLLTGSLGLVLAQVLGSSQAAARACLGILSLGFLGSAGDAARGWHWAALASPFRLRPEMDPGGTNRWLPLAACLAVCGALVLLAAVLAGHRDLGAGLVGTGRARARGLWCAAP